MKSYIQLLVLTGLLASMSSCSSDKDIVSSKDRTFILKAYEKNQIDMQYSQIVRTRSTFDGLSRYAQLLIQRGSERSDELMALASKRDVSLAVELTAASQNQVSALIATPQKEFASTYLTTIIQSRKNALELYQQQIRNGSDNVLREWASGQISQLVKEKENAEELMNQLEQGYFN